MPNMAAEQLVREYGAKQTRLALMDLRALSNFLQEVIISDRYKPSTELLDSLKSLSPEGVAARKSMGTLKTTDKTYSDVNLVGLSQLYALLELVHEEPLLDLEKTDPKRVAAAIANEVIHRELQFPFLFGREIYDKAAQIETSEVRQFSFEQSEELLQETPIGVVHLRHFLIGPWGLIETPHLRNVGARRDPYLQHSSDRTILHPHRVWLRTSARAAVNVHRSLYIDTLNNRAALSSDWPGYFRTISKTNLDDFDEKSQETLPYLIGDVFSDRELVTLLSRVFRDYSDDFVARAISDRLQVDSVDHFEKVLEKRGPLNRAQVFQLLLCATDEQLWNCIGKLVRESTVEVPRGERRVPVLNGHRVSGQWGVSIELGSSGLRTVASFPGMPFVRLESVIRRAWNDCGDEYRREVRWALRNRCSTSEVELDDVLTFSREAPIHTVLLELFARRRAGLDFCERELRLALDRLDSDRCVCEKIAWALDLPFDEHRSPGEASLREYEDTANAMRRLIAAETVGDSPRKALADLFPSWELYLREVLCYVTWSLLGDHYGSPEALVYYPREAEAFTAQELFGGRIEDLRSLTLGAVSDRIRQLVNRLKRLQSDPGSDRRSDLEVPNFVGKTNLQGFPFVHYSLFADLDKSSQARIVLELETFCQVYDDSTIAKVRNASAHGNRDLPAASEILGVLDDFRRALLKLEALGLAPVVYERRTTSTDEWGRSWVEYKDAHGRVHKEFRPTELALAGVPGVQQSLLVMSVAKYGATLQNVLFAVGYDSEYHEYWSNFPKIPETSEIIDID